MSLDARVPLYKVKTLVYCNVAQCILCDNIPMAEANGHVHTLRLILFWLFLFVSRLFWYSVRYIVYINNFIFIFRYRLFCWIYVAYVPHRTGV